MNGIKRLCLIFTLMISSGVFAFAQTPGVKIVSVHPDLKIKITRCEAAAKTVIIDLMFENVGSGDVKLYLKPGSGTAHTMSTAYDDEGNVYTSENFKVQLGTSVSYGWDAASQTLPAGVPIKGRIKIEGVQESATVFKRIDLWMSSGEWGFRDKVVKMTNVPISREGDE